MSFFLKKDSTFKVSLGSSANLQRTFNLVAIHELKRNVGVTLKLGKFIHERKQSYERIANFG